jgi:hypothetical protein
VATVTVTNPPAGHLTLTPSTRALSAQVGHTSSTPFTLGNDGTAGLHASVGCTNGATASPASTAVAQGATQDVAVGIPSFSAAGTQTVVCTATPTDTSDAPLTFTATVNVGTVSSSSPCAKGGVWSDLDSLGGSALRDALYTRIKDHTALGYDLARDKMFGSLASPGFDVRSGLIESIYSGVQVAPDGTRTPGNPMFNTEHTWPQSFFSSNEPMKSDLHHLFPTDETSNSRRSNYPFAEVTCPGSTCTWTSASVCNTAYCSAGGVSELGSNGVFEVRQKQRGDSARAIFYFAARYPDQVGTHLPAYEQNALKAWSTADPPDQFECDRNDSIESLQHNRNPFVDRPEFIEKIGSF